MTDPSPRSPLSTPVTSRRPRISFDSDAVGRYSEAVARFFGTGTYLLIQTIVVIVWIIINVAVVAFRFDPYPFILLNLAFSTQAAYAAPLILLAQNRQEARDRVTAENDRRVAAQSRADMDFLAREIASLRMRINDMPTRDFIRSELRDLLEELNRGDEDDDGNDKAGRR